MKTVQKAGARELKEKLHAASTERPVNGHADDDNDVAFIKGTNPIPEMPDSKTVAKAHDIEPWPTKRADLTRMFTSEPPEHDWFAWHRLHAGRGHLLSGIGGSSKTRMQIQLAIAAVIGRLLWGWKITKTGSAMLLLTEDTEEDFWGPVHETARAMGLSNAEIELLVEKLHIYPLAGEDSRLLTRDSANVLMETHLAPRLLKLCEGIKDLVYIGLDPAAGISDGAEADPLHQRRTGEFVDKIAIRTGACAVLNTHAAKSLQTADDVMSHTSRGSGALTDSLRGEFTLRSMTKPEASSHGVNEEERGAYVQLFSSKSNHLSPEDRAPIWLRRGNYGVLHAADLGEPREKADSGALTSRHTDALRILATLGSGSFVGVGKWRDAMKDARLIKVSNNKAELEATRRIASALREHGLIKSDGIARATSYAPQWEIEAGSEEIAE